MATLYDSSIPMYHALIHGLKDKELIDLEETKVVLRRYVKRYVMKWEYSFFSFSIPTFDHHIFL